MRRPSGSGPPALECARGELKQLQELEATKARDRARCNQELLAARDRLITRIEVIEDLSAVADAVSDAIARAQAAAPRP